MNDIPQDTPRAALINSLLTPSHEDSENAPSGRLQTPADVMFGLILTPSRLDDELSVAVIEFSNTPTWLLRLNRDPCGFPKKTPFGTLWRGIDPNAQDEHGKTEFIKAVLNGATEIHYPEMLAEFADTDVNIQDTQGRSALHWACAMGLAVMVQLCLSVPECDIGLRDNDGLTAFDLAGQENIQTLFYSNMFEIEHTRPEEALLRILSVTSQPARAGMPVFPGAALFDPVQHRNQRLVKALINRGVDLTARNEYGDTALHVAAAQTDTVEITTLLVQAGSDVNAPGNGGASPLHCAAKAGLLDVAQLLLGHGASARMKDHRGQTALQVAEGRADESLINLLTRAVQMSTDPSTNPILLVHRQTEADIELKNENGLTALLQAVEDGDQDRVRALLALGAEIEAKTGRGKTALHIAAFFGHGEIVRMLLAAGADARATTGEQRETALHMAAVRDNTDIVSVLLVCGADINAVASPSYYFPPIVSGPRDTKGVTALSLAAVCGRTKTVKALAAAGANLEAKDDDGLTALSHAAKGGMLKTMTALLDAGAQHTVATRLRYIVLRGQRATELGKTSAKLKPSVDKRGKSQRGDVIA